MVTDNVDVAVDEVLRFYTNFHSYRFCGNKMSIRMHHELHDDAVEKLNEEFSDLLVSGKFHKGSALPQESNEPQVMELPRLLCKPHRRSFGRWRQVIDFINVAKLADSVDTSVKAS